VSQLTRTRPTTQVNLLPPETKEQQKSKRQVGLVMVVGGVLVGLLVLYSLVQGAKVADLQDHLGRVNTRVGKLQAKAQSLQQFEIDREETAARLALVQGALAGGVRWSRVMQDVSRVVPDGVWLTSVTGAMNSAGVPLSTGTVPTDTTTAPTDPTAVAGTTPTSSQIAGTLTFTGYALDIPSAAEWLQNLEGVDGWANAYSGSVAEEHGVNQVVYEIVSSVDITANYVAKNGSNQ
jgi:Tfp pilus assembly protein PilN